MTRFKVYIDGNGKVFCQSDTKTGGNFDAYGNKINDLPEWLADEWEAGGGRIEYRDQLTLDTSAEPAPVWLTSDAGRHEESDNTSGSKIAQPSHDPIEMSKPYIYLNCSQFDEKEARAAANALRELGYQVWLDETVFQGRLWSEERSDAIQGCDLLFELDCGKSEYISYICETANEFAKQLGITRIIAQEKEIYRIAEEKDQFVVTTKVSDEDFVERCCDVLKLTGLLPDAVKNERSVTQKWDLFLKYYKNYRDQDRGWASQKIRYCNLRTREVYDWQFKQVFHTDKPHLGILLGNEDVYRAMVWKKCGYRAILKSKSIREEYIRKVPSVER